MAFDVFLGWLDTGAPETDADGAVDDVEYDVDDASVGGATSAVPRDVTVTPLIASTTGDDPATDPPTAWKVERSGSANVHVLPTKDEAVRLAAELAREER